MKKIIYILLAILILTICLVLDSNAVSSGTYTVNQWGSGDFLDLTTAEAGLQGVLISSCYIVITGSWTSAEAKLSFSGWTTFSTATVIVQATGLARHTGIWNDTAYRIDVKNNVGEALYLDSCKNIYLDGLQVRNTADLEGSTSQVIADNGTLTDKKRIVSNSLICGASDYQTTMCYSDVNTTKRGSWEFYNDIIYQCNIGIIGMGYITNSTWTVYNCTISSCNTGLYLVMGALKGGYYYKNNLVQNCIDLCYDIQLFHTGTDAHSNNVSDDGTSPDGTSYQYQKATFVSSATLNFHLLATDTTAYARGINLASDGKLPFNTDIDGQIRPTNWSIGADDIPATTTRKKRCITIIQ